MADNKIAGFATDELLIFQWPLVLHIHYTVMHVRVACNTMVHVHCTMYSVVSNICIRRASANKFTSASQKFAKIEKIHMELFEKNIIGNQEK